MKKAWLLNVLLFAVVLLNAIASAQEPAPAAKRVIILGFDGVDPVIASGMMEKGELPNLKRLKENGSFQPLESSNPPQSPTAWSSFNTCRNPLNHGIYDFLRRTPSTYIPGVGFGRTIAAELAADGSLLTPPRYENNRVGENFWKIASDQGKRVKALVVPFAYPADELGEECTMLCGLDVPDIRGTQSTYFAFSEGLENEESVPGGKRLPLRFDDARSARVEVPGIAIPGQQNAYAEVPVTVTLDEAMGQVQVEVQGQTAALKQGEWSEWLEWTFELSPTYAVKAISRFHVMSAAHPVRLYMTCLQFHPKDPMIPMSTPPDYTAKLAERKGLFKTIGWVYDTKALQQDDMTEEMFLEDVERTMAWREQVALDELDAGDFDIFVAAWTATDRVGHMFWAYRDPKHPLYTEEKARKYGRALENTYIKMDSIVGNVMQRLQPGDLFMVMSDHGFHSFRTKFSVNTWLVRNGYLAVKGQDDPATAATDTMYLQDFDWGRSKAYGLGLGMIFLNRSGREGQGIVSAEEAPALAQEIKSKLMEVTDPETQEKVFRAIYTFLEPQGIAAGDAPDIQLGYAEGYQTDKRSAGGAAPAELFAPNEDKWSGEHASSDVAFTQGVLFSNQSLAQDAGLIDLGVTAFEYLGLEKDPAFEGKSLLVGAE